MSIRQNSIDPQLDIHGLLNQNDQDMILSDEPLELGIEFSGQNGSAATISSVSLGIVTITGLTGMTASSVGNILYITGADSVGNNGAFLISAYNSATSVDVVNSSASAPDANDGSISWSEREPYSLESNINYSHTDRRLIKGTTNWYDDVPVYQRPTAIGTDVPANLANIAGKTTDAQGFIFPRGFRAVSVTDGDGYITMTSVGNLPHSDSIDKTGVPLFDVAPYTNDWNACYVLVTNPTNDNQLQVTDGSSQDGYVIFGITRDGYTSIDGDAVEIKWYAVQHGSDLSSATEYTWTANDPTTVDLTYGYFLRLDQADEYSFRRILTLGVTSDADLRQDINDLQIVMGAADGSTSLASYLTNTVANYTFFNLPDGTPSVVEALNTLNAQIGDRTYTGAILTSGETIATSLQSLSDAIAGSSVLRIIERLSADIDAFTAHTLPASNTYTLDGTNNGQYLSVYWRGILRNPGSVAGGDEYEETSTTQITPYIKIKAGDHINYFIRQ